MDTNLSPLEERIASRHKKLAESRDKERKKVTDCILRKLYILEKMIMADAKKVYEIKYYINENIKGDEPAEIQDQKIVLADNYEKALKAVKEKALKPVTLEEGQIEITYSDFELISFKQIADIDLFG